MGVKHFHGSQNMDAYGQTGRTAYKRHWKRKMETKHLIVDQKIQNNPLDNLDTLGIIASFIPDNNLGKYHTKWCVIALLTRTAFRKYWRQYHLEVKCRDKITNRLNHLNNHRVILPRIPSDYYYLMSRRTETIPCVLYPKHSHKFEILDFSGKDRVTRYYVDGETIMQTI